MSPTNRNLIVAGVIVFIALLAWFLVIQPKRQQEAATRDQIANLQTQYDNLKRVADQKPLYLALTKQVRQRLTGVELTADPRAYIPSYLKQIEDLAKKDGLQVALVAPQATPSPTPGPSVAPGATPNAQAVANAPLIGGPIRSAARVAGSEGQANQTTSQAQSQTFAGAPTPIPGSPAGAASFAPGRPGGSPKPQGPATARQKAIAYLNQSFTQVPMNMEFDGTYNDLQRFLRDLNKFPKLLGVGDLTLAPGSNAGVGSIPRLRITLPITAYRLSPNAPAQPAPVQSPGTRGG
ncbi:MAG TPA: type 4a pilus biogenesis protein PilO [Candidatus Tumulicola sp.]|nr:type 4a pilus biogenesis protein PilO [Candidatus Tumulicola sp.]